MRDLPARPSENLSPVQLKAFHRMRELLKDLDEVDRRYDELPQSENGKIISTDIARFLDRRYAKEPSPGKTRDMQPSWDLAWRYAQNRLERDIRLGGKGKLFRMMAGGWAAGKTHAIRHLRTRPDLVWDGTLSDPVWASQFIDFALQHYWKVEIVYIYRNLELALYGALERTEESGRAVPLRALPQSHVEAQESVLNLSLSYADIQGVSFLYIHNLGKKGAIADPLKIHLKELELHGALHYFKNHAEYYKTASSHLIAQNHET